MNIPSQKTLEEVFNVLELQESERVRMRELFKKRLASDLLKKVKHELPQEYIEFLEKNASSVTDPLHPMVAKMSKTLQLLHSTEEYDTLSEIIMKELIREYVSRVENGLSADKIYKLKELTL